VVNSTRTARRTETMKPTKPPTTEPARARRGRRPIEAITEPQRRTLAAIRTFASKRGYPPTMDELGEVLGIAPATAHEQVTQLVRKGYLRREPRKARSLEILKEPEHEVSSLVPVPIVGTVPAGQPLLAAENVIGELLVDGSLVRGSRCFALQVRGDSMVRADIRNGDYVVVRQQQVAESGDIVVALLGEEATVKRLRIGDDRIELRPENPRHRPIVVGPDDDLRIQGKVIAVRRRSAADVRRADPE
jgi:repressor LexA